MTRRAESGFSLVEVLVVTIILGVITYGLTEIVILTLRTTEGTANRISESTAAQAIGSYFTGDAQSAQTVAPTDTNCAKFDPGVFLRMSWSDQAVTNDATYSIHRPNPAQPAVEVLRWSCPGLPTTHEAASTSGASNISLADEATSIDNVTATASLDTGNPSASLTLDNYDTPALTPGGAIHNATLRVARSSSGDIGQATVTPLLGGVPCAAAQLIPNHSDGLIHQDTVDLTACNLVNPQQLSTLSVAYSTHLSNTGTAATDNLDGVVLDFSYPQRRLVGQLSSPDPGPAAVVALCDDLPCIAPSAPVRVKIQIPNGSSVSGLRDPSTAGATGAFTNPDNAKAVDGTTSDAALDGTTPTGAVSLGGYDQPEVPPNSIIDTAVLRVTHQDDGDMGAVTATVNLFSGSICMSPIALNLHPGAPGEDQIDLKACGLTDPARLTGLTVTYSASLAPLGTAASDHLDGIVLDLTYRPAHSLTVARRT